MFDLGTYAHNPLKEWLQANKEEEYPALKIERNSVSVDWDLPEKFGCNTTLSNNKSVHLKMHHASTFMEKQKTVMKLILTQFEITKNRTVIDLRCLPWKVKLNLTIAMLKFKGNLE